MKRLSFIITFFIFGVCAKAQTEQEIYEQAFQKVNCMLLETCSTSFKDAVFTVENAYYSNKLERKTFEKKISIYSQLTKQIIASRELVYNLTDKDWK